MSKALAVASGVDEIVRLQREGMVTPTQFKLTDKKLAFETWEALCSFVGKVQRSSRWWVGDLLNFGESVYGEDYAQGAEATGLEPSTLIHYAYVARSVPPSRRKAELPFSSHALVAPLEPKEQKRWLDKAVKDGWTRQQFRQELRDAGAIGNGTTQPSSNDDGTTTPAPAVSGLESASRYLLNTARKQDGDYVVTSEAIARVRAALGMEE